MKNAVIFLSLIFVLSSCLDTKREVKDEKSKSSNVMITQADIKAALDSIKKLYPEADLQRVEKGLGQIAALWFAEDGTAADFIAFCSSNYIADEALRETTFNQISKHIETLYGYGNKMMVDLLLPSHVSGPEPLAVDLMFGGFNPSSHLTEDMFNNKIAFYVLLNFPVYTMSCLISQFILWPKKLQTKPHGLVRTGRMHVLPTCFSQEYRGTLIRSLTKYLQKPTIIFRITTFTLVIW